MRKQSLLILGSSGSIGAQTLQVVRRYPERYQVHALVASSSYEIVYQQCLEFKPVFAYLENTQAAEKLRMRLQESQSSTIVLDLKADWSLLCASRDVDVVVSAIVGAAGLVPTIVAAQAGKKILLANKEALVMAGSLLMQTIESAGAVILPVDSEHNAIFQSMPDHYACGQSLDESVSSIILTASGGPFLDYPKQEFSSITPAQAVAHPNWSMGAKISVDSATMMNKVLEVVEAHYLFSVPQNKIEVIVHPESIIHSMVRYKDGSVLAQMGTPDMRIPLAYCLAWPERMASGADNLDFSLYSNLSFQPVCSERFPCVKFIQPVLREGQSAMIALNAANEIAVAAFLEGRIRYPQISELIDSVLQRITSSRVTNLDEVLQIDQRSRALAQQKLTI
jgi:1-deoxy-D-xylulose-5-phosphate reductoisomerase